jgi:hypothetical protein
VAFSRLNPSPRYEYLLDQYKSLHIDGEKFLGTPADRVFPGQSLFPQLHKIKQLIDTTNALTLLDYGCGKGMQYNPLTQQYAGLKPGETVMDYWDIDSVHCYDPCVSVFSAAPTARFDGVISTDVLEHCPEEDIQWIVDEIFGYADKFVFANVACYPAKKRLPNGENAHCTIKSVDWWKSLIDSTAANHPQLKWSFWIQFREDISDPTSKIGESQFGNVKLTA